MQIAVVLSDDEVDELDSLVPDVFASRAEAVRTAVGAWLAERRAAAVDRRYEVAYDMNPPQEDDVDGGRLRGNQEPAPGIWEDLDW